MTMQPRTLLVAVALATAAFTGALATPAQAGTLEVNIAFKGASQRAVWTQVIDEFKKTHPGTDVKVSFVDEEAYKVQLPNWLTTAPPDIVNWHNGERMAFYAKRGLFEDLSGDWQKNGWDTMYASTKESSTYNGKQYAAPTVYYSWGMFYRKDLFQKVGIANEPKTWNEFLDDCKKLKAAGITPIAVGGRDAWTLAGWFDYLDLRLNGNKFHQQLMAGEVPYTDPRVKKVYTTWKQLLDAGYFIDNSLSYDLDAAQPFLFQGKAAMML
ncbi:extracellular solute-binding protein, partial [Paraburkholderia tropica]